MLNQLARVAAPLLVLLFVSRSARASPWFGAGDSALEDKFEAGDLDEEDLVAIGSTGGRAASRAVAARSWVSLSAFVANLPDGRNELAGIVVVGVAFDKIAAGDTHRIADPPKPFVPPPAPPAPPPASPAQTRVTPKVARAAVAAALRASGIGADDSRIDDMVARARRSAALPETRLRAMRLVETNLQANTLTTEQTYYDTAGANLWLEARLTWRLDKLVFADDEPTLERVRLETQEARARVTTHVLELLFSWQRAELELAGAQAGSREQIDAMLRELEAEATLDTLTAGWFAAWRDETQSGKP